MDSFTRAGAFLCALFIILLRYLQAIDAQIADISPLPNDERPTTLASKFRLVMTAGQTFSRQGRPREQFYEEVLDLAEEVRLLCFMYRLISIRFDRSGYHRRRRHLLVNPCRPPQHCHSTRSRMRKAVWFNTISRRPLGS